MEVIIVYDNKKDKEFISLIDYKFPIFFQYINMNTTKGRKEGYKIKSHFAARLNPFAVVLDDSNKPIKVFYSEAENVISSLTKYINEYEGKCNQ